MKKAILLLLALCMLLCACAAKPVETTAPTEATTEPTEAPTTEPTEAPTAEPTEAPTTAPTDPPEPEIRNPLTGEALEEEYKDRPYTVIFDNAKVALPHWGVGQADMIWEVPHEGGVTRTMAVYSEIGDVSKIGPNRSARPYTVNLTQAFDAIFVHAGGTSAALNDLKNIGWNDLDSVKGSMAWKYFHRDQDRLNAGIALEHTMYSSGAELEAYANALGYATSRSEAIDFGLNFAMDGTPDGEDANTINIRFRKNGKKTDLYYNGETGLYTMEQYDRTYIDGITGNAVTFENVLILEAETYSIDDYGHLAVDLVDSGDGYYACGGKIIPIEWSRGGNREFFTFTLEDGTPLTLGTGTSYVAVVYEDAPVSYS